jgi:hypothetical protein
LTLQNRFSKHRRSVALKGRQSNEHSDSKKRVLFLDSPYCGRGSGRAGFSALAAVRSGHRPPIDRKSSGATPPIAPENGLREDNYRADGQPRAINASYHPLPVFDNHDFVTKQALKPPKRLIGAGFRPISHVIDHSVAFYCIAVSQPRLLILPIDAARSAQIRRCALPPLPIDQVVVTSACWSCFCRLDTIDSVPEQQSTKEKRKKYVEP